MEYLFGINFSEMLGLAPIALRCSLAIIAGLIIGLERQLKGHSVGIKTTTLISLGACIFVLMGYASPLNETARMAAAVVTGIGFLCSGTIFRGGLSVKGINTSATIWICAGIGCLAGTGHVFGCLIASLFVVFSNLIINFISNKLPGDGGDGTSTVEHSLLFEIPCSNCCIQNVRAKILEYSESHRYIITECVEKKDTLKVELTFFGKPNTCKIESMANEFSTYANGKGVSWKLTR